MVGEEQYLICKFGSVLNCGGADYVSTQVIFFVVLLSAIIGMCFLAFFQYVYKDSREERRRDYEEVLRATIKEEDQVKKVPKK